MISKSHLAIGASLLFALLCSCGNQESVTGRVDVLRRGLSGEPSTLDPAAAADNFSTEVLRDLYEGLTAESPTGEIVPGVAMSWTVDPSGRKYTFKLRPDARWSNGVPVRAQDFVAAWRRVVDPKQGSPVADDFRFLTGAQSIIEGRSAVTDLGVFAPSDDILIVTLEQPVPYFLQLLTHSAAYPLFTEASTRSHDPDRSITNGPFSLASWSPSTALWLTRNEHYWDRGNVHIARVEYQFISDENAQYARFRAGQLDMTDTVPPNAVGQLRIQHSPELSIAPFLATAYYGLNLAKPPFGGNLKLRQALAMAIDRKKIVTALGAGQAEAFGFVPTATWNYSSQSWPWKNLGDDARIAEARRLYTEAGYSSRKPLHLRLLFNSNAGIKSTAIIVAAMWKEVLNVDTALTDEEYRVFLESRHDKSRWDVLRLGWTADYNDAGNFLDAFRQHSENNDEEYANAAFDALVAAASQTADSQRRRAILEMSEATMLADYPVIPLYFFVSKRLVKTNVKGFQANAMNHVYSKSLSVSSNKP